MNPNGDLKSWSSIVDMHIESIVVEGRVYISALSLMKVLANIVESSDPANVAPAATEPELPQ